MNNYTSLARNQRVEVSDRFALREKRSFCGSPPLLPLKHDYNKPRPIKPWETDMTLCIGALAQDNGEPRIVLCFDAKVTNEAFGSETEVKFYSLSDQIVSLFADSPARAKELAWIFRDYLGKNVLQREAVVNQLREPIGLLKRRLANAFIQRTLAISYEDMVSKGAGWFGETYQREYLARVENNPLRVQLIVAGFIDQFPVLCELGTDGELEWRTSFSIVGNGAYTAEPAMHARSHTSDTPLVQALYNVYEAKRVSEINPYVGRQTAILILEPARDTDRSIGVSRVTKEGSKFLDKLYKRFGPKKWNPSALPEGSTTRFALKSEQ
jgi:hypothetical protein